MPSKKSAPKKTAAKKTVVKKATTQKSSPKKPATKKTAAKSSAKKTGPKKSSPQKTSAPNLTLTGTKTCMCKKGRNGKYIGFTLQHNHWVQILGFSFDTKEECEAECCAE
jgi:hypothetical protein